MRFGKSLEVGAHVFEVRQVSGEEMGVSTEAEAEANAERGTHFTYYGDMDPGQLLLRVNKDVKDSCQLETLMHEIDHAVVEYSGVRGLFKSGREEEIVQAMAHLRTQVFQRNLWVPRLFLRK